MAPEIAITTSEAAAAFRVSVRTVQRWAKNGTLTAVKRGGRWAITFNADLADFPPTALAKARDLLESGSILATSRPGIYTAVSSDGSTTYLVHRVSCTCPAGRKLRPCYHRAAVALIGAAHTARMVA
ncbi:helix-turn-helix domain-containing protein [Nonomuraea angiospora]|uniref:helix-turn-helix domain-containing protein n=1 Tax=Nonomuraea angiospora TaxID=46172 RepID=UPI0029B0F736|nr:helix-turn-helix domain-containing protein [Nonomuraea angiospora]MDX3100499.1 helix-turn-helix domain-containing protein [Nonomuraea angiospora]